MSGFIEEKLRLRKLSHIEADSVCQRFVDIVVRRAGVTQFDDDPADVAVVAHGLRAMREALIELRPEWAVELDARLAGRGR